MSDLLNKIKESVAAIRSFTDFSSDIGIILGTGLGDIVKYIETDFSLDYTEIPHFPVSTVEFHSGKLIFGKPSGKNIIAMQGRFHYYEGYSMHDITYPVRILKELGIKTLIISNACGSMNPFFKKGSLMIIDDHINLLGDNPLIGVNEPSLGPRFVDMSEPYSQDYISLAEKIALENGIKINKGVYAAMSGPSLETRAEYRFLRGVGADVVGMSTVPECIVANQCGMKVLGLSIITDECLPDTLKKVHIDEIIAAAAEAEPSLTRLVKEFINRVEI